MCQVNPDYNQHLRYYNENKVLYLLVFSSIYGFIGSTLFWYKLFSATLEGLGFEINPYEICVANKMVEGAQYTIAWYVDDNKMSHKTQQ